MNLVLIFLLSLFGLVMGFATVFFVSSNAEPYFWMVIFLISAYLIARRCTKKYFLHGFLIGVLNSVWITLIQIGMYDEYTANHPEMTRMIEDSDFADSPKLFLAISGPLIGVLSGLVLGLFSFIAGKFIRTSL